MRRPDRGGCVLERGGAVSYLDRIRTALDVPPLPVVELPRRPVRLVVRDLAAEIRAALVNLPADSAPAPAGMCESCHRQPWSRRVADVMVCDGCAPVTSRSVGRGAAGVA